MVDWKTRPCPLVPADLGLDEPSLSGSIKTRASDFRVTEIPAYEYSGQGDFLYLKIRRKNLNTKDVCQVLSRAFSISEPDIGYAGLKDKHAECTQTFSFPLSGLREIKSASNEDLKSYAEEKFEELSHLEEPLTLLSIDRHENSLRRGHLKGNHFSILIRELKLRNTLSEIARKHPDLAELSDSEIRNKLLESAASRLVTQGMVNLFGSQRFGKEGSTLEQGLSFMDGKKARKWLLDLGTSAVQSYVFNHYLRIRAEKNCLFDLMDGDLATRLESGGIFKVPESSAEAHRLKDGEISYTGPIFGRKMRSPEEPSLALERDALNYLGRTEEDFKRMKVPGARRAGLIFLKDLTVEWEDSNSVWLHFTLPAGSYATVAAGHLIHLEVGSERDL